MDQIIQNPGLQHTIIEKFFLSLPFKDIMTCQSVNKSLKEILTSNSVFWIKKWSLKGLSKKNRSDWIKAICLAKNIFIQMMLEVSKFTLVQ